MYDNRYSQEVSMGVLMYLSDCCFTAYSIKFRLFDTSQHDGGRKPDYRQAVDSSSWGEKPTRTGLELMVHL